MERNIKLLALFNFFTDFKFYSAVLVLYFAKVTGSFTLAMSLFSVVMISGAFFEIPTGILSDFLGRKKTILAGAIFSISSVIFYAVGNTYWILFFGAICEGVSRAFYSGNNNALLHDSLSALGKRDSYDHYLGRVSAMFQAALTVGVVVGSIVAYWSFSWVMWLSVIPQIVCFIVACFLIEPKVTSHGETNIFRHLNQSLALVWKNKKLRLLTCDNVLGYGVGEATFEFKSAFIATLWPVWAIGLAKMISYIGGGISFWFAGRLIKKYSALKILLFEATINRFINTVALIFPTVVSPVLMSTTSFLFGATEVASNTLMQKEFSDTQRATIASITSFGGSIVYGIFAVVLGFVADKTSPVGALLFSQVCSLPRIAVLLQLKKELTS
jgi:MFS family permease